MSSNALETGSLMNDTEFLVATYYNPAAHTEQNISC
jgi:hypothetical protein